MGGGTLCHRRSPAATLRLPRPGPPLGGPQRGPKIVAGRASSAGGCFLWAVSQLTRAKSQNKRETGSSLTSERTEIATGSNEPRNRDLSAFPTPSLSPAQGRSLMSPEEQVWGAESVTREEKSFGGYESTE